MTIFYFYVIFINVRGRESLTRSTKMKYYVYDNRVCNVVKVFDTFEQRLAWLYNKSAEEKANFELYQI